jgi:hypothetical protein
LKVGTFSSLLVSERKQTASTSLNLPTVSSSAVSQHHAVVPVSKKRNIHSLVSSLPAQQEQLKNLKTQHSKQIVREKSSVNSTDKTWTAIEVSKLYLVSVHTVLSSHIDNSGFKIGKTCEPVRKHSMV